ncbi:MAG: GDP-6-deoxy-D-mannose reductase [Verrucomicrobia bacterium ADurb.Bin474]|nr:MAG: GDP-6-deoxy-D-mannose reductase [Verrucomicrobia bacterium ADurb.Bin474]
MKALITGSTGMIGGHFVRMLREKGWEVHGLSRPSAASRMHESWDYPVHRVDLLDREATVRILDRIKPDRVVHMAAQAFNGTSWDMESYTHLVNFNSTLNVLWGVRQVVPEAGVLLACSSAEYGCVDASECPLVEDRPLRPVTPYGVSKVAGEALGFQYHANYGTRVFLPRLFIHVGTGHPPATAIQNFARQLALIRKGKMEPVLKVGRLDTARDFIDVRDGVSAMLALMEHGKPGVPVNICNGEAPKISEVLDLLIEIAEVSVRVESDPSLMRLSDEAVLLGDNTRLKQLGWSRRYSLRETLNAVFEDWMIRTA